MKSSINGVWGNFPNNQKQKIRLRADFFVLTLSCIGKHCLQKNENGLICVIFAFTEDLKSAIIYTVLLQLVSTQRDEVKGTMRISYNKLFKLLIDKGMKKKELREKAGISASTVVKMGHNEPVSIELIGRICLALDCNAGDVVEFFPDEPETES